MGNGAGLHWIREDCSKARQWLNRKKRKHGEKPAAFTSSLFCITSIKLHQDDFRCIIEAMRTTITLDDQTHEFAAYYARARGLSLGAAIDELIRKAQAAPAPIPPKIEHSPNGLPLLPRTGRVITSEMVKKLSEEEFEP